MSRFRIFLIQFAGARRNSSFARIIKKTKLAPFVQSFIRGTNEADLSWQSGFNSRSRDDLSYALDPIARIRERESLWVINHIDYSHQVHLQNDVQDTPTSYDVKSLIAELGTNFFPSENDIQCLVFSIGNDDFRITSGGIQVCVGVECSEFNRKGINYLHMFPSVFERVMSVSGSNPELSFVLNGKLLISKLATEQLMDFFIEIQRDQHLELRGISIHGLLGHDAARVLEQVNTLKYTPIYFWIHDYSMVCSSPSLAHNSIRFCGAPEQGSPACNTCMHGPSRSLTFHPLTVLLAASQIKLVAPSTTAAEYFADAIGKLNMSAPDIKVMPHGELLTSSIGTVASGIANSSSIRVAFVGNPLSHKGWFVFQTLAETYREDKRYEFVQFGMERGGGVQFHFLSQSGKNPNETSDILRQFDIDVVVCWSTWPETFGLIAHEATAAGCYVISTSHAGNIAQVISTHNSGMILESETELFDLFAEGDSLRRNLDSFIQKRSGKIFTYTGLTLGLLS